MINSFANRYVLGDFCVCREDWLTYSGETDNPCLVATPIIMGGLNLKIAKILWGQKFLLDLWGNKPVWGELKLYVGSNISYHNFIISFP